MDPTDGNTLGMNLDVETDGGTDLFFFFSSFAEGQGSTLLLLSCFFVFALLLSTFLC